jgi:GNAT superfamily N-acetyltransferase
VHAAAVDATDPTALRAWHELAARAHRHDRPDAPFWTADEVLLVIRPDDPEERMCPFVVVDETGEPAASGIVFVPLLDNLDKVYAELRVLPGRRGEGAGDVAVAHAIEVARAEGRQLVLVTGYFPADADDSHPVRAFARRHGFTLANTEVRRTLELPVSAEVLQSWVDEAAEHHAGYEITTYVDVVPDPLLPSLVDLLNQLAVDAPTGDIDFEAGRMSVDIYRDHRERLTRSGRRVLETVAVQSGRVVAHSTLSVPPPGQELPHLNQWGTFVDREHRGHRLGLAVKAANLRRVQRLHPERTLVHTTNSPVNGPMVAINERLGFVPREVMGEFLLRV